MRPKARTRRLLWDLLAVVAAIWIIYGNFRRIATRYDRLARNYLASVCLVAALVWWS
jgi:hypothetical protein